MCTANGLAVVKGKNTAVRRGVAMQRVATDRTIDIACNRVH